MDIGLKMNARPGTGNPVDIKAVVCAVNEHGHEILKENTELQIPMFFQHMSDFKQYVSDFVGVDSIANEVGFNEFDTMMYRLNENSERFAIRTQHQYSMEMMKFFCGGTDKLEVMICKKIMACVKGRLGSVLIVPMETGGTSGIRSAHISNPVVFQREDETADSTLPHSQADLDLSGSPVTFERKRKKNPQKAEDCDLFEKIRHTNIVHRNQRQQAAFDELADMLKDLSGSIPVSEGKVRCGNCGKERLVCPNRNNVGRVKYFRRKHYDNCLALTTRGPKSGNMYLVEDSSDGNFGSLVTIDKAGGFEHSGAITPPTCVMSVIPSVQSNDSRDSEIVFVKHEQET